VVALVDGSELALAIGVRVTAVAVVVLVAAVVLEWSSLVPVVLFGIGGAYATRLALDDPPLDVRVAAVGGLLYLAAELAYWSLEKDDAVAGEPGAVWRRVSVVIAFAVGALVLTAFPLALLDVVQARGLAVDLIGAAAAAGALLVLALAARRVEH
jgi:hypothetical protein